MWENTTYPILWAFRVPYPNQGVELLVVIPYDIITYYQYLDPINTSLNEFWSGPS